MGLIKLPAMADVTSVGPDPLFQGSGKALALEFDSGESVRDTLASCSHLRNKFTIMAWIRQNSAGVKVYWHVNSSAGAPANSGEVQFQAAANTTCLVVIRNIAGTIEKQRTFTIGTANQWHQIIMVVNVDASQQLTVYSDGADITGTGVGATNNTLTDRSGYVAGGGTQAIGTGTTPSTFVHSIALWNKALNQNEVTAIYNNGKANVNLLKRKGKYRAAKHLYHWFVFEGSGATGPNMGKDYGKAHNSEHIDLMRNAVLITAADDLVLSNTANGGPGTPGVVY